MRLLVALSTALLSLAPFTVASFASAPFANAGHGAPPPGGALVDAAFAVELAVPARPAAALPFDYPLAARPIRIATPYSAPPVRWQAGHLGVDLAAAPGASALAPGPGIVSFAGTVVDRGIVVIDHGDIGGRRLRTTLEPLDPAVAAGQVIAKGEAVGIVAGGHRSCAPATCLHWGVRLDDEYRNPLAFLGPRRIAVLLPEP